jgi:hypothetical protein
MLELHIAYSPITSSGPQSDSADDGQLWTLSEELVIQQEQEDTAAIPPPKKIAKLKQTTLNFVSKVVCQPSTSKSIGIRSESERENDTSLDATPIFNSGAVDLRNNDSESNELERSCEDIHQKSPISTMNTSEDFDPDCGLTFDYDIGHFVSRKANDLEKSHMLKNKWQARPGFN